MKGDSGTGVIKIDCPVFSLSIGLLKVIVILAERSTFRELLAGKTSKICGGVTSTGPPDGNSLLAQFIKNRVKLKVMTMILNFNFISAVWIVNLEIYPRNFFVGEGFIPSLFLLQDCRIIKFYIPVSFAPP